ncbi:MAG: hypothetical protein AAFR52_02105 [Pseudomonadota bacterium]
MGTHPFTIPTIDASAALAGAAAGSRVLIDLRKRAARAADGRDVAGSVWVDPYTLDHAHPLTEAAGPLAVFCLHGHEVSHFACTLLMLHGRDVVLVEGGFEALADAGARLVTPDGAPA